MTTILQRKVNLIVFLLLALLVLLIRCGEESAKENPKAGDPDHTLSFAQFAGSSSCAPCHRAVYDTHQVSGHHLTSQPVTDSSILGSFIKGRNAFRFDAATSVVMERRDSSFFQVHYRNGQVVQQGRFDVVVGSGKKGQSYLQWLQEHYLVQMPITYFTPAEQWSNSPGYPPSTVVFNRPITSRCLECHSTFAATLSAAAPDREAFDKNRLILGVECERCHGPGAQHVRFQAANPATKEARFIVNPAKLSRSRQIDLCALCHGGKLAKTKPSFSFTAGDSLGDFFSAKNTLFTAADIDVHGNQHGLLSLSKCFTASDMTCGSCHNVHQKEVNKTALFSQRCQSCHQPQKTKLCKLTAELGPAITVNCIDCHMPKQPSHAVAVFLQGATSPTPARLRTHLIKPYPEEVNKVKEWLRK